MDERTHTDEAESEPGEDLELRPEDSEDVLGGRTELSDIPFVKSLDKPTSKLYP